VIHNYWQTEWLLYEKVEFDGINKRIIVHPDVASLDIRSDVYSAWVRWVQRSPWAVQAMRVSGADLIPGGETGLTFFTSNGWKLVYDPAVVAVSGVLYSDDYATPYWSSEGKPLFPATVSALVNSATTVQNIVTGTAATPEETAAAVWTAVARTLTESASLTPEQVAKLMSIPTEQEIAAAMLAEPMPATPVVGSFGEFIKKKMLTVSKFIGLK
jgi:hypothetical protein